MANESRSIAGAVSVRSGDSAERVAFDLLNRIEAAETGEKKMDRAYYLALYRECLTAVLLRQPT